MNAFAAIPMNPLAISAGGLVEGVGMFFQIYFALLLVRILLSWFPNIDWSNPVFATISQLTDPYLDLFRSIIPPIGGLDLSSILAIFAVQIAGGLITDAGRNLVSLSSNSFAAY
jgi:YggT family protein